MINNLLLLLLLLGVTEHINKCAFVGLSHKQNVSWFHTVYTIVQYNSPKQTSERISHLSALSATVTR